MTEIATCPERTIDPGPCEPYINEFCIHCGGETIMPKNAEQYAAQAWAWVTLGNIAVPGAVAAVKALTPFFASAMAEARGAVPGDVAEVLEAIAAWRALTPEERNTALDALARAARETMERGGTGAYGTRAVRLLSALAKPDGRAVSSEVADGLKGPAPELTLHDWSGLPALAKQAAARIADLTDALRQAAHDLEGLAGVEVERRASPTMTLELARAKERIDAALGMETR